MAKRESAVPPKRGRGGATPTSPAKERAQRENLAKGRAAKAAARERAKELNLPTAGERWAMLLDGRLTVGELDDEEIHYMRVRNRDGGFGGPGRRLPSHLAQQFQQEAIKRATELFRTAAPRAVARLLEIANDPDVKDADAIRALDIVLNRGLGKVPETVRVEAASRWEDLLSDAVGVDRRVDDPAGEAG